VRHSGVQNVLAAAPEGAEPLAPDFDAVYRDNFAFVWRNLSRLGVDRASLDDAAQDVFLVVHRRLPDFDARVSIRAWLVGITYNVSLAQRRRDRRRRDQLSLSAEVACSTPGPHDRAQGAEAVRFLESFLSRLEPAPRAVFILAELEQMTAPEIAVAVDAKLNTIYSRLRAARAAFRTAIERRLRGES
jgi:RNA polymerase sigma-70 factor (ECF subfamily)